MMLFSLPFHRRPTAMSTRLSAALRPARLTSWAAPALAALLLAAAPAALAQFRPGELTDDQVQAEIKKFKQHLLKTQRGDGSWSCTYAGNHSADDGGTVMATLALLVAGESMQRDEMAKALKFLQGAKLENMYEVCLRAHVWSYLPNDYRDELQKDVASVIRSMGAGPFWGEYTPAAADGPSDATGTSKRDDMSMSQYGWLALWQGRKRGLNVPPALWDRAIDHLLARQLPDGGWSYYAAPSGGHLQNQKMTCAAMAVLYVAQQERDRAKSKPDPLVTKALDKGWEFLEKNYNPKVVDDPVPALTGYQHYGYERVCLASGRNYIQKKDWFKTIGAQVIAEGPSGDVVNNAFKLMFLARGAVPVWCNKIEVPLTESWRNRPNDIYFVNQWLSEERESEINWVIQHIDDDSAFWLNAPVAYLSTDAKLDLTDAQKQNLKAYVDHGGLLLLNGEDSSGSAFMNELVRSLWPDYKAGPARPGSPLAYGFKDGVIPGAKVVHNGARDLVVLLDGDQGFTWQKDTDPDKTKPAWQLAWNIYQVATDKGQLTNRLVSPFEMPRREGSKEVEVVIPTYKGNCQPEGKPYDIMAFYLANRTGLKVKANMETALSAIGSSKAPLVHLQGTDKVTFSAEEINAIKAYAEGGGTVLVEAVGGLKGPGGFFASEAQVQLEKAFGTTADTLSSQAIIEGSAGDGSTSVDRALYRRFTVESGMRETKIQVRAIKVKGREAILFSDNDLTLGMNRCRNYGINGYAPDTAQKFMLNLIVEADKTRGSAN